MSKSPESATGWSFAAKATIVRLSGSRQNSHVPLQADSIFHFLSSTERQLTIEAKNALETANEKCTQPLNQIADIFPHSTENWLGCHNMKRH